MSNIKHILFPVVLCFTLAFIIRWDLVDPDGGPSFSIKPDSLEYSASAQAIAKTGKYFLQVGPATLPPRYPPGWPLILSVFLQWGTSPESIWRVPSLFGALHAALLAMVAFFLVRALMKAFFRNSSAREDQIIKPAIMAALIAGIGWAITPASLDIDRHVMSDEAAAFFGNGFLVVAIIGILHSFKSTASPILMAALSGVLFGVTVSIRPTAGVLLVIPASILILGRIFLFGKKPTLYYGFGFLFGLAIALLPNLWLLHQSGYPLTKWTNYDFWAPEYYRNFSSTFNSTYAWEGNPTYRQYRLDGQQIGHANIAVLLFSGLGRLPEVALGRFWPFLSLLLGVWLLWIFLPKKHWRAHRAPWLCMALTALFLISFLLHAFYFFPAVRFYLQPMGWMWVILAMGVSYLSVQPSRWSRMLAWVMVSFSFYFTYSDIRPMIQKGASLHAEDADLGKKVRQWLRMSDAERTITSLPFDPLKAQALGFLTPETVSRIGSWGLLPEWEHFNRIREKGFLSAYKSPTYLLPLISPIQIRPPNLSLEKVPIEGVMTQTLMAHPSTKIYLPVSVKARFLYFGYGIKPEALSRARGVRFRIDLLTNKEKRTIFQDDFSHQKCAAGQAWYYACLDLESVKGSMAILAFSTEPLEGNEYNWAAWVNPLLTDQIESPEKPSRK